MHCHKLSVYRFQVEDLGCMYLQLHSYVNGVDLCIVILVMAPIFAEWIVTSFSIGSKFATHLVICRTPRIPVLSTL